MKKILLSVAVSVILNAGLVDGVSILVNNEPITLHEIDKRSAIFKASKKDSIEMLIEEKLIEQEIVKRGIEADYFEVENEIEKMATSKGMTIYQLKNALMKNGVSYDEYSNEIKKKVQKDKLFKKIAIDKVKNIDNDELKLFFNQNSYKYNMPQKVELINYVSQNQQELMKIISNPMYHSNSIDSKEESVNLKELNPQLADILVNTKEGQFSQIIPFGDKFVTFYIKKKLNSSSSDFESVKNRVLNDYMIKNEDKIIKEYFVKVKATSNIKIVRVP
ncbi:MAG: hypothetical protein HXX81_02555 [Campylobacterales bacterium]|nr:hypothetical protein [Campylobacterales bacterium]